MLLDGNIVLTAKSLSGPVSTLHTMTKARDSQPDAFSGRDNAPQADDLRVPRLPERRRELKPTGEQWEPTRQVGLVRRSHSVHTSQALLQKPSRTGSLSAARLRAPRGTYPAWQPLALQPQAECQHGHGGETLLSRSLLLLSHSLLRGPQPRTARGSRNTPFCKGRAENAGRRKAGRPSARSPLVLQSTPTVPTTRFPLAECRTGVEAISVVQRKHELGTQIRAGTDWAH